MSDTDDTDVLLLIPPDFFTVHSDSESTINGSWSEGCGARCNLVHGLIHQIGNINTRLTSIENSSDVSSFRLYNSIEEFSDSGTMSGRTNHDNNPRCVSSSAKSTPQKPRSKYTTSSLPNTPQQDAIQRRRMKRAPVDKFENKPEEKQSTSTHSLHDRDADESSIATTPEKRNNKEVLGEIDQFLSHVKTIKRYYNFFFIILLTHYLREMSNCVFCIFDNT